MANPGQPRDATTGRYIARSSGSSSGGGGTNLGSAHGEITISTSGISAAVQSAQNLFDNALQSIGGSLTRLGDRMASVGSSLTILTAPITAFGVAGVRSAMSFEDALKEIQARAGLTADQLEAVKDKALQLGADTAFSAGQAADAFLQLLTSGQSVEEAMRTIDSVMTGAAASGMDLGQTADTLTDIMAQFSNQGATAGEVLTALTKASGASSATFGDLAAGFQNVGGLASQLGLSVADTSAILATFSENGIKGAEAGTQLKSMLTHMSSSVDSVQDTWKRLNVSMFDTMGNARPLNDVIRDLNVAMADMSDQERVQTIQALAGSYGQLGLQALLASDGFGPMLDSMRSAADAGTIAEARMDTFRGTIDYLMGSVETLNIKVLTPFMNDTLKPLVKRIGDVVNRVAEWVDANPELAQTIVRVLAGVAAAGPALLALGKGLSAVGGLVSSLGSVLGLLLSPVGLVVGAIGGLALALDQLGIIDLGGILGGIAGMFQDIVAAFQGGAGIFDALGAGIGGNLGGILESLGLSPEVAANITQSVLDLVANIETGLGDLVNFVQTTILPGLQQLADWFMTTALPAVVGFVQTVVVHGIQGFFDFLAGAWEMIRPGLETLANWFINDALPGVVGFITGTVIPGVQSFINTLAGLWAVVAPALESLANWFINEALPTVLNFITETALPGIQSFIDMLIRIWNDVSPFLVQLFDWFINTALPMIIGFINDTVIPAVQTFIDILTTIWTTVQPYLQQLYDWFITSALPGIMSFIQNTVTPAIQGFINLLSGIWTTVQPALENFKNGIKGIFEWIKTNVIDPIIQRIQEFQQTVSNLAGGLGAAAGAVGNAGTAVGMVTSGQVSVGDFLGATFRAIGSEIGIRDSGGPGQAGQPYLIGTGAQPEMFVPQTAGQFIPNATQAMGGGITFQPGSVVVNANSAEGGAAAGAAFVDTVYDLWKARGN